jgi:hypothetical protein
MSLRGAMAAEGSQCICEQDDPGSNHEQVVFLFISYFLETFYPFDNNL